MEIRMKDVVGVQEFYNTIKDKKVTHQDGV